MLLAQVGERYIGQERRISQRGLRALKGHGFGGLDACKRGGRGYRASYVIIICYVFDSSKSFPLVNSVVGLFHSAGHATDDNQDKVNAAISAAAHGVYLSPLSDSVVDQSPFCS